MEAYERALDVALIVMENGGSTANAERTFRNVLKGYKHEGGAVGWRLDLVTVSGTGPDQTSTVVRAIGPVGVNLVRASAAVVLGERVARGEIQPAALPAEIERVKALPFPYKRAATMMASALTSAFICRLLGGDMAAVGIAFRGRRPRGVLPVGARGRGLARRPP